MRNRLRTLTAADVMCDDVATIPATAPIEEALATLEDYGIHGAPVTGETGEVVGVFSETDLLRRQNSETPGSSVTSSAYDTETLDRRLESDGPSFFASVLEREIVADWMTPRVIAVRPDTPLAAVCRAMVAEHVHRVLVTEEGRLRGVISALDIVQVIGEELGAL